MSNLAQNSREGSGGQGKGGRGRAWQGEGEEVSAGEGAGEKQAVTMHSGLHYPKPNAI